MAEKALSLCPGILEFSRPWSVFSHPLFQDGKGPLLQKSLFLPGRPHIQAAALGWCVQIWGEEG